MSLITAGITAIGLIILTRFQPRPTTRRKQVFLFLEIIVISYAVGLFTEIFTGL